MSDEVINSTVVEIAEAQHEKSIATKQEEINKIYNIAAAKTAAKLTAKYEAEKAELLNALNASRNNANNDDLVTREQMTVLLDAQKKELLQMQSDVEAKKAVEQVNARVINLIEKAKTVNPDVEDKIKARNWHQEAPVVLYAASTLENGAEVLAELAGDRLALVRLENDLRALAERTGYNSSDIQEVMRDYGARVAKKNAAAGARLPTPLKHYQQSSNSVGTNNELSFTEQRAKINAHYNRKR